MMHVRHARNDACESKRQVVHERHETREQVEHKERGEQ